MQGIDICIVVDEKADEEVVPLRPGGVEGEHAVEEGVDRLVMGEVPFGVEAQLRLSSC